MVYCSSCGTANRDGSRFCNDCGAKLPSGTSVRCPQCGTPNSPADTFCEKCHTRLVPTLADDAPEPEPPVVPLKKGLSLPTKPDADAGPTSADWLGQLRTSLDSSAETEAADSPLVSPPAAASDEVPDWLTSLGIISGDNPPPMPVVDDDVPEWLSQLPLNAAENSSAEASEAADWLSNLRAATPVEAAASPDEDLPEWLRALGTGPLSSPQPDRPVAPAASDSDEEEIPEWMRTLGTGPLTSAVEPEPAAPAEPASPADWLTSLRASAPSIEPEPAPEISPVETLPPAQAAAPEELPDWLRNLGAADHSQHSTDELPDWLDSLGAETATPEAPAVEAETPDEDDVPAWLRDLGASAVTQPIGLPQADLSAAESSDWMSSLRAPDDQSPAPSAEPLATEEDVPDWLQSMGLPASVEAPTPPAADTSDWMSALRATSQFAETPEPTSEPVADDVPEWLQSLGLPASAEASAPAVDETSDWMSALRATSQSAETPEPTSEPIADNVPDWLQAVGMPASDEASAPVADEVPDWMSALRATSQSAETPESTSEPVADDVPDWLQSLGTPSSAEAPVSTADDTSDWMSALRATSQSTETPEPTSEPVADDMPDWLQSLGMPASAEASAPAGDEVPDWMSALRATSQSAETPEPASEPIADDVPEWLQSLRTPSSVETSASAADDTSDWMSALRATSQSTETPEPTSEPVADDVPDWLQAVGMPASAEASAPAGDEVPDWMSALRATSQSAETPAPTSEPTADDVPDWLQAVGMPASSEESAPAADEVPDWMSALRSTSQSAETPAPTSEPVADDVPDWLQAVGMPASAEASAPAADDTSDWMSALRATSQSAETPEQASEPTADDVPDWLQAMGQPISTQTPVQAADDASDWMSVLRSNSESVDAVETTREPAADDVPDWLRNFDEPTARSVVAEPPVAPSTADDIPDWLRDVGAGAVDQPAQTEPDEVPDWLQTTATVAAEPAATIEPANELPDWLSGLQMPAPAPSDVSEPALSERLAESPLIAPRVQPVSEHVEDQPIEPVAIPAELPEWLKSLREGKVAAPVQSVEPTPGLIQAEIPSWLEALRPKEGPTTSVADLAAEAEQEDGVFAGLANVLAPLPGLSEVPAPVVGDVTGPSADDLARAGIFQELLTRPISRPTAVAALTTVGKPAQRRVLQWAVAILLLAVVIAPFLELTQGLSFLPQADRLPPSALVQAAVTKITVLPPNANVLVVFDYEPTQAGEMNRIAEVMLRHLQTRAANITAVSLNPLGADLAASLWSPMGVPAGDQHHNLGYVPGQAIGVQNVLLNNGPFDLVIALSASSDSLRWWVEQIAVSGFDVPLIAGVSAAVESLALPYAHSGQVAGLVSGATGAMMYAQQAELLPSLQEALRAKQSADQTQQPPSVEVVRALRNQVQIEAQALAHWLLAILIVIGLVSGLVARVGRRSTP